jgi:ribonuclease VapC
MIVVDTSALLALLLDEPTADSIAEVLAAADRVVVPAGTFAEALIVAARRGVEDELRLLLDGIGAEVESLDETDANAVAKAHAAWGKGHHPASLNFGDCFAYASARRHDARLLFVGTDFSRTDVVPAL